MLDNSAIASRLDQDAQTAAQKLSFIDSFIKSGRGDYAAANSAWMQSGQEPTPRTFLAPDGKTVSFPSEWSS